MLIGGMKMSIFINRFERMGRTVQDRSPQRNYIANKPSLVGKGLEPFRNMVKRNGTRPFPTAKIRYTKTERRTLSASLPGQGPFPT